MKKKLAVVAAALLLLCAVCLSACVDPSLKEVEGTYEMTEISGSINGTTVTKSMYEYFRIILDGKGKGTVQSKASGSTTKYEATGRYTYSDGVIKMTTTSGSQKVTEEYTYEDGVITYSVNQGSIHFTVVFQRVED